MNCPKCSKAVSKNVKVNAEDGGLLLTVTCDKCNSEFETFVSPTDLDEVYIDETEFALAK
jgi:hypothetical protein